MSFASKKFALAGVGAGVLMAVAACAPPAAAPPAGGGGPSSTKNVTMSCVLDIYDNGAFLFQSPKDYTVTLTLNGEDVASGQTSDYTANVTGITNGPLASQGGWITARVSIDDGPASDSPQASLNAAAANAPIVLTSPIAGTTPAITGDTKVEIVGYDFYAQGTNVNPGDDDWAEGSCTLDPGEEPTITVGTL